MSIISKSFVADNLRFAIGNMGTTLTAVKPTNGETYQANKQGMEAAFEVFENGREVTIDTKVLHRKRRLHRPADQGDDTHGRHDHLQSNKPQH